MLQKSHDSNKQPKGEWIVDCLNILLIFSPFCCLFVFLILQIINLIKQQRFICGNKLLCMDFLEWGLQKDKAQVVVGERNLHLATCLWARTGCWVSRSRAPTSVKNLTRWDFYSHNSVLLPLGKTGGDGLSCLNSSPCQRFLNLLFNISVHWEVRPATPRLSGLRSSQANPRSFIPYPHPEITPNHQWEKCTHRFGLYCQFAPCSWG